MRRKSFKDITINYEQIHKNKSPRLKKQKSRSKIDAMQFCTSKSKFKKSKLLHTMQLKNDVSETRCSNNILKHKCSKKREQLQGNQIFELINHFAIKIQKQWRVYSFRKNLKFMIANLKKLIKRPVIESIKISSLKNSVSINEQSLVSELQSQSSNYNLKKYEKSVSLKSSRSFRSENSSLRSSFLSPNQYDVNNKKKGTKRKSLDNMKQALEFRRFSGGVIEELDKKLQKLSCGKAFEIHIENNKGVKEQKIIPLLRQNDRKAFQKKKNVFGNMFKKCKKFIEEKKLKKLLSIQTRYNKNEMTEGSYRKTIFEINEKHKQQIQILKLKQGVIKQSIGDVMKIYKKNLRISKQFQEDIQSHEKLNNTSNFDQSASQEKWDFNSSSKRLCDSNFESFSQLVANTKIQSIENVLQALNKEDQEDLYSGRSLNFQKKNQIQEGNHLQEYKEKYQQKQQNQQKSRNIFELDNKFLQISLEVEVGKEKQKILDTIQNSVQIENITQIDQLSLIEQLNSKGKLDSSEKKFSNNLSDQKSNNIKIFQNDPNELVQKLYDLVNQKIVLSNIKFIHSIKFMFFKINQDRLQKKKQQINLPFTAINTDVLSLNNWLLEISHFVLDNHLQIFTKNLIFVKQPSKQMLLTKAKNGQQFTNVYEIIPEYVFKQFQFNFIKTLAYTNDVSVDKYDKFSTLSYVFHRCLIDCLNLTLLDELLTGKDWLQIPWKNEFKKKRKIEEEHAKSCLQRAINAVSNWGQYGLSKIQREEGYSEEEYKQFQMQKQNLVAREEILNMEIKGVFTQSHLLLNIAELIFEAEIAKCAVFFCLL